VAQPRGQVTREDLLQAALSVIADHGIDGLNVRAVSKLAGCSTTGIYTHFGGKQGLLDAAYMASFEALDTHAVPFDYSTPDAFVESMVGYWRWALAHPTEYMLIFASKATHYVPSEEAYARGAQGYDTLRRRVSALVESGILAGNPDQITIHMWSTAHGLVMIEIAGAGIDRTDSESVYRACVTRALSLFVP